VLITGIVDRRLLSPQVPPIPARNVHKKEDLLDKNNKSS
jgi:hypothetical protein